MKNALLLLVLLSPFSYGERFANWTYIVPESSPFVIKRVNNGLYLQLCGETNLSTKIAIQTSANEAIAVYVLLDEEQSELFPFQLMGATVQKPQTIHLLHSEQIARELIKEHELNVPEDGIHVVGRGRVNLSGLNSGGDCGQANYFVFDYKLTEFTPSVVGASF